MIITCFVYNAIAVRGDETQSVREEIQVLYERLSLVEERLLQHQKEGKNLTKRLSRFMV